jgi:hypothetical protein
MFSQQVLLKTERIMERRVVKRGKKAIPIAGRGGPQGCEMSRLPYILDNRLTDGGRAVSLTLRPHFTQEYSWYSFLLEAESRPGP